MTLQETTQNLKDIKEYYTWDRDFSYYGDDYRGLTKEENEAIDRAIKALEELPKRRKEAKRWKTKAMQNNSCDDAISRQAAIDAILTKYTEYERLKMLHFTPNIIKQECADLLTDLTSIQPIRPRGHWIKTQVKQGGISEIWYNCSECGWRNALYLPRSFCPNCGCRMVEPQESEV